MRILPHQKKLPQQHVLKPIKRQNPRIDFFSEKKTTTFSTLAAPPSAPNAKRDMHLLETFSTSAHRVSDRLAQGAFLATLGFAASFVASFPTYLNNTMVGVVSAIGAGLSFTIFGLASELRLTSEALSQMRTPDASPKNTANWDRLRHVVSETSKSITLAGRLWKAGLASMALPLTMNFFYIDQNWNLYSGVSAGITLGFFACDRIFRSVQRKLRNIDADAQTARVAKLPVNGFGLMPQGILRAVSFLLSTGSDVSVLTKIGRGFKTVFVNENRWLSTPILLGAICAIPFASTGGIAIGAFALSALCLAEFSYLVAFKNEDGFIKHFAFGTPLMVGGALVGLGYAFSSTAAFFPVIAGAIFLSAVFSMFSSKDSNQVFPRLAYTSLGMYIPITLAHLPLLHALPAGPQWTLGIMLVTALGDMFAQLSGSAFGKTKLSENKLFRNLGLISPKKTFQGIIGQSVGAFLTATLWVKYVMPVGSGGWVDIVAMGLMGAVIGPLGDIMESAVKRHFRVKDSGGFGPTTINPKGDTIHVYSTLPGHGGWLDRTDGHIWNITAMYYYLHLIRPFFLG